MSLSSEHGLSRPAVEASRPQAQASNLIQEVVVDLKIDLSVINIVSTEHTGPHSP